MELKVLHKIRCLTWHPLLRAFEVGYLRFEGLVRCHVQEGSLVLVVRQLEIGLGCIFRYLLQTQFHTIVGSTDGIIPVACLHDGRILERHFFAFVQRGKRVVLRQVGLLVQCQPLFVHLVQNQIRSLFTSAMTETMNFGSCFSTPIQESR